MQRKQSLSHMISRRGARILLLVVDNHASRLAHRMACALLRPHDELQVITVVTDEDSRSFGDSVVKPFADTPLPTGGRASGIVLVKGDARLSEVITEYAEAARADLVVCGSHHLGMTGTRDAPLPASGSFSLRLAKSVRCCPLLVVKANNTGHFLQSGSAAAGLRVLVDCQSNTRHLLSWLMDRLDPDKDGLYLAVTRAIDQGTGMVKETARRMLTNFSTQAAVSEFYAAQRVLKDPGPKALPQAAKADAIDIIALQAPNCKTLPQAAVDVLKEARTSVLIFNRPEGGPGGVSAEAAAAAAGPLLGGSDLSGLARISEAAAVAAAADDLAGRA